MIPIYTNRLFYGVRHVYLNCIDIAQDIEEIKCLNKEATLYYKDGTIVTYANYSLKTIDKKAGILDFYAGECICSPVIYFS